MNDRDSQRSPTQNQTWWEGLSRSRSQTSRRAASKDGLYAMTCGWPSADISMMVERATGDIKFPIPAYLIEHPKGYVLFDTGMHSDCQHDPRGRIGTLAENFHVRFRPGEDIEARLTQLEIDPGRVEYVVNSHLHFDHTGGNALLPNARIVIQHREWEAGRTPELMKANAYDPRDYDLGHLVMQVQGEHDLFGDGSVVMFPTYCQNLLTMDEITGGSPYGAQMRNFLDQTGPLWMKGSLIGKVASVFTSTATQHGGHQAISRSGSSSVPGTSSSPQMPAISSKLSRSCPRSWW
jgi:hypothetical protein